MSSDTLSRRNQQSGSWPLFMGGITFLITTLYPPFSLFLNPPFNLSSIVQRLPQWLALLVEYNLNGGIVWLLIRYAQENTFAAYPPVALLGMILPFCTVPIVLTLSSILTWRRVVNRAPHPMPQHGLLAVIQAAALSLLVIVLLSLLFFGITALFSSVHSAALLGMTIFAIAALAQSLWVLPALLVLGGGLAMVQGRSLTY